MTPIAAPAARPDTVAAPLATLQRVVLWLFVFSGWFVLAEPAPYEFLFLAALVLFLPGGLSVSIYSTPLVIFLLLYNAGGVASLMPVLYDERAVQFVLTSIYLATTAIFFAFVVTRDPARMLPIIRDAYILAGVVAASLGLIGYFDVAGLGEALSQHDRARGTFKDPNVLGAFLVAPAAFLLHGFAAGHQRFKPLAAVALLVILAALLLAMSRGAWFNMAGTAVLVCLLCFATAPTLRDRSRVLAIMLAAAILCVALVVVLLAQSQVRDLMMERATIFTVYDIGETGRFGNQLNSIPLLLGMPNGMGPLQFTRYFDEDPHNVFLNAFASYGWLGGLSFLLLTVATFTAIWRSITLPTPWRVHAIMIASPLVMTFVQGIQIDTDHWRHFYLLLGTLWGLYAASEMHVRRRSGAPASRPVKGV